MTELKASTGRDKFIIGRSPGRAQIVISHPTVSSAHGCLAIEEDGTYTLIEMGSANGMSVLGDSGWHRIATQETVRPEDRVKIGGFETTVADLLLQLQDVKKTQPRNRTKVFISYRRADTEQVAGRIFDYLKSRYGEDSVFYDTEAIPGAVDFRKRIQLAVNESFGLVAVIGPQWTKRASSSGFPFFWKRHAGEDFVEIEIEAAIRAQVSIVPVLVMGATVPRADQLGPAIRPIVNLNALTVRSGRDFHKDMDLVHATLEGFKTV